MSDYVETKPILEKLLVEILRRLVKVENRISRGVGPSSNTQDFLHDLDLRSDSEAFHVLEQLRKRFPQDPEAKS